MSESWRLIEDGQWPVPLVEFTDTSRASPGVGIDHPASKAWYHEMGQRARSRKGEGFEAWYLWHLGHLAGDGNGLVLEQDLPRGVGCWILRCPCGERAHVTRVSWPSGVAEAWLDRPVADDGWPSRVFQLHVGFAWIYNVRVLVPGRPDPPHRADAPAPEQTTAWDPGGEAETWVRHDAVDSSA